MGPRAASGAPFARAPSTPRALRDGRGSRAGGALRLGGDFSPGRPRPVPPPPPLPALVAVVPPPPLLPPCSTLALLLGGGTTAAAR
mmetsp:Transcript_38718/g.95968  ORF Transcript_38718/g.95968 Transcript_38718/m.95968 type:complete len:86 (+) Transcript_38718:1156-1413(+)